MKKHFTLQFVLPILLSFAVFLMPLTVYPMEPSSSQSPSESASESSSEETAKVTILADEKLVSVTYHEEEVTHDRMIPVGDTVDISFIEPEAPSIETLKKWILFDGERNEISYGGSLVQKKITVPMPEKGLVIDLELKIDADKEESSIEASEEESRKEAANHIKYGDYTIDAHIVGVTPPERFILANDTTSFSTVVEAFFSTSYRQFVYYAEKDGKYDYCVKDPVSKNLFPLVTFLSDSVSYMVIAPENVRDIPGIYRNEDYISVNVAKTQKVIRIPSFNIIDDNGAEVTLLYLSSENGKADFYVYSSDKGLSGVITYDAYNKGKGESKASESQSDTPPKKTSGVTSIQLWIIIISILLFLLIMILIVVFVLSKRKENADDDDEFIDDDDEAEEEDEKPFDLNFENTFPEEMKSDTETKDEK